MRHALIIEDDPIDSNKLKKFVEDLFDEITVASDGAKATEQLKNNKFDVIFMDMMIPGSYGIDLLKLAKTTCNQDTITIVISSKSAQFDIDNAKMHGAKSYLVKPYNKDQLIAEMKSHNLI